MRISDDRLLDAIIAAIGAAAPELDARGVAEEVVAALTRSGEDAPPALLTVNGRVLLDFVTHPESSLQESADRLGFTSPNVAHAMTRLVEDGWGVRTRVGGRNRYRFDRERLLHHRDITAVLRAVGALCDGEAEPAADST